MISTQEREETTRFYKEERVNWVKVDVEFRNDISLFIAPPLQTTYDASVIKSVQSPISNVLANNQCCKR